MRMMFGKQDRGGGERTRASEMKSVKAGAAGSSKKRNLATFIHSFEAEDEEESPPVSHPRKEIDY